MTVNSDNEATRKERVRAMRQRTAQLEREGMYWTVWESAKLPTQKTKGEVSLRTVLAKGDVRIVSRQAKPRC